MTRDLVLMYLPPATGKVKTIKGRQSLNDIKTQIENAHRLCAPDYDKIAHLFMGNSDESTLRNLFTFLKMNIRYREEPERAQYTKSPAALIETGESDCKMYASFIGGVLDALNRQGANFDWYYAFASYPETEHVFVIANINGRDYWVDPVASEFDTREPSPDRLEIKKIGAMALYHMSGIEEPGQMPVNIRRVGTRRRVGCGCDTVGCSHNAVTGTGVKEWVEANPILTAALVAVGIALFSSRKKRRAV